MARFPRYVAARYFRSARADAFVRLLARLTAGGLAVGVAALVLALAALSGFQSYLLSDVKRSSPAIEIALPESVNAESVQEAVRGTDGVATAQLVVWGRGWLLDDGELLGVEVVGYESSVPAWLPDAKPIEPTAEGGPESGLVVPRELLNAWRLEPGQLVRVVSPRPTLTPVGPQPRTRSLPLFASFRTLDSASRSTRVALPLAQADRLFGSADRRLDVTVEPGRDPVAVADQIRGALAPQGLESDAVRSWRELNRALLFVLRLEKGLIFTAVFLIVVVASLALVAALSLIVSNKRAEVGILNAMGAGPTSLRRIFLALGALLAVGGTVAGGTVGVTTAWLLDRFELLRLPNDTFFIEHVPFEVRTVDVLVIVLATCCMTLAASWLVSRRVSRLDPIRNLREARS